MGIATPGAGTGEDKACFSTSSSTDRPDANPDEERSETDGSGTKPDLGESNGRTPTLEASDDEPPEPDTDGTVEPTKQATHLDHVGKTFPIDDVLGKGGPTDHPGG